jgi:hypothetical protein
MRNNGVRKVPELRRHIDVFVRENFEEEAKDHFTRRKFHPSDQDIRNILKKAKNDNLFTQDDQVNLFSLVDQWQERQQDDSFFYRSHGTLEDDNQSADFLFCYQANWQKRLLARYGGDLCLLDATYRTSKYALPLFFLCVRTNVKYIVVGVFITQRETTEAIVEALEIFKEWNGDWHPNNFMTDYSAEEITALETVFQGMTTVFHVKKHF